MRKRQVLFGAEAKRKLLKGANLLADAVKVTHGAQGRSVVIGAMGHHPRITRDGVTVAKSVICPDPMEEMGASLIREAAQQTVDKAGDGTTTSTVLAQYMINEAVKAVEKGANPIALKNGIEGATRAVVDQLRQIAIPVSGDMLTAVAIVSSNNDPELGALIASVVQKVGKDGIITIERSNTGETTASVVEGMKLDRGYLSPYFVTNPDKNTVEYNDVQILICDRDISQIVDMIPIMEQWAKERKPLLIIANDINGETFGTLVMNKTKHNLPVCAVKTPGFGDLRKHILEDIAVVTGGKVISEDKGLPLKEATLSDLGHAAKIIVENDKTIIIGGAGDQESIQHRCENLSNQIASATHKNESELIRQRLAAMSNGIAVIYAGGVTETEVMEKIDRIDDAKCATQAAMEEGICAGGGVTYLRCIGEAVNIKGDEKIGANIVFNALEAPFKQILHNAGITHKPKWWNIGGLFGSSHYQRIMQLVMSGDNQWGINVKTGDIGNMINFGIVDPVKVARIALENACAVACMFLITECVSGDLGEDTK